MIGPAEGAAWAEVTGVTGARCAASASATAAKRPARLVVDGVRTAGSVSFVGLGVETEVAQNTTQLKPH